MKAVNKVQTPLRMGQPTIFSLELVLLLLFVLLLFLSAAAVVLGGLG